MVLMSHLDELAATDVEEQPSRRQVASPVLRRIGHLGHRVRHFDPDKAEFGDNERCSFRGASASVFRFQFPSRLSLRKFRGFCKSLKILTMSENSFEELIEFR